MLRLALKNLLQERTRLAISAGGVAAALFLVLLVEGAFEGTSGQLVAYLEHSDADVWAMQEGVSNMHMSTSALPASLEQDIAKVPGVGAVTPILYASSPMQIGGQQWFSYIVGLKPAAERGGPWAMKEGTAIPARGEAVLSNVLAARAGVRVGDTAAILGRSFKIVGLSQGTFSMANSITFVAFADLEEVLATRGAASYFLVRAQPGVQPEELAARIRAAVPGTNALTRQEFVESDRTLARQMGTDLIQVMSLLSLAIGVLVVGLTVYTATVRRAREYGIAKALGARNGQLLGVVLLQTLAIVAVGLVLALALAYAARPVVQLLVPETPLVYRTAGLARLAAYSVGIAALASLVPAWRIGRVEPMVVFKE